LDIASKVVPKICATERVGVLALRNGRYTVLEYTEISEDKRVEVNKHGELVYNASHLVINNFKLDFVLSFSEDLISTLPYVSPLALSNP
jgi:UDP-N-acetylglucosamine/UDP-N-acetylgalactosamine diphosphorylase